MGSRMAKCFGPPCLHSAAHVLQLPHKQFNTAAAAAAPKQKDSIVAVKPSNNHSLP